MQQGSLHQGERDSGVAGPCDDVKELNVNVVELKKSEPKADHFASDAVAPAPSISTHAADSDEQLAQQTGCTHLQEPDGVSLSGAAALVSQKSIPHVSSETDTLDGPPTHPQQENPDATGMAEPRSDSRDDELPVSNPSSGPAEFMAPFAVNEALVVVSRHTNPQQPGEPPAGHVPTTFPGSPPTTAPPPLSSTEKKDNSVQCETCGMTLIDRVALDRHVRSLHFSYTPFRCQHCGKQYARRDKLRAHMEVDHLTEQIPPSLSAIAKTSTQQPSNIAPVINPIYRPVKPHIPPLNPPPTYRPERPHIPPINPAHIRIPPINPAPIHQPVGPYIQRDWNYLAQRPDMFSQVGHAAGYVQAPVPSDGPLIPRPYEQQGSRMYRVRPRPPDMYDQAVWSSDPVYFPAVTGIGCPPGVRSMTGNQQGSALPGPGITIPTLPNDGPDSNVSTKAKNTTSDVPFRLYNHACKSVDIISTASNLSDIPPYTIVSHVWGDVHSIKSSISGVSWLIPISNSAKLAYVTAHCPAEHIWMDILCLNQADQSDICAQIQYMGEYYAKADKCVVLLEDLPAGLLRDVEKELVDLEKSPMKGGRYETSHAVADRAGKMLELLAELGLCGWWKRVWTFQEACLPKRIDLVDLSSPTHHTITNFYRRAYTAIGFAGMRDTQVLSPKQWAGHHILAEWNMGVEQRATMGIGIVKMLERRTCSMPEDQIYGVLGMLAGITDVTANIVYHKEVDSREERLQKAWVALGRTLVEAGHLQILTYAGNPSTIPNSGWIAASPTAHFSALSWKAPAGTWRCQPDGSIVTESIILPVASLTTISLPASQSPDLKRQGALRLLTYIHTLPRTRKIYSQLRGSTILIQEKDSLIRQLFGGDQPSRGILNAVDRCLDMIDTNSDHGDESKLEAMSTVPEWARAAGRLYARAPWIQVTGRVCIGWMAQCIAIACFLDEHVAVNFTPTALSTKDTTCTAVDKHHADHTTVAVVNSIAPQPISITTTNHISSDNDQIATQQSTDHETEPATTNHKRQTPAALQQINTSESSSSTPPEFTLPSDKESDVHKLYQDDLWVLRSMGSRTGEEEMIELWLLVRPLARMMGGEEEVVYQRVGYTLVTREQYEFAMGAGQSVMKRVVVV
ncbi:hypothetical protein HDV00_008811 [Rhizophlyctis rosea]|nr:hypothetical protein HDV00_008811 [Rhizophlyctis rosea]